MSVHYLYRFALVVIGIVSLTVAQAAVLTPVRGVVHDPHHRPVADATVTLHAADSDFVENEKTNSNGEFSFSAVPLGVYVITVADAGFDTAQQSITVASNTSPVLHFELEVATVQQSVTVTTTASEANVDSITPTTLISAVAVVIMAFGGGWTLMQAQFANVAKMQEVSEIQTKEREKLLLDRIVTLEVRAQAQAREPPLPEGWRGSAARIWPAIRTTGLKPPRQCRK